MFNKIKEPAPWYIVVFLFGIFCWVLTVVNNGVITLGKRVDNVEAKINNQNISFIEIQLNLKNIAGSLGVDYIEYEE